ncbi:Triosephosphate isomerase [uncultured Desulfobacterium sp.]|uniref:Triosephosphate isomerase n=1 Tax=uncultured Desulfobacterium sp. TaxID=201089 RepID=A0A445MTA3_9BACT|nr:Triosephosphate isomerase [uncultured Desulfobacterium sp.]
MFERRPLIAGNWKMNLSIKDAVALIDGIAAGINDIEGVDVLVAPPFTTIASIRKAIGNSKIFLAAQNMHNEMSGAFTGEVSGRMIQEAGCTHVILGHSERRALFHETSQVIDLKVKAAAVLGLIPIVCIGETLEERESGKTFDVIRQQLDESLMNFIVDQLMLPSTILAYEPVWAIGTGKTATPDQAQEVHGFIRNWIEKTFKTGTANQVRILYGGSVKADNIAELMAKPDIDGALVGGASLKAESFVPIIRF